VVTRGIRLLFGILVAAIPSVPLLAEGCAESPVGYRVMHIDDKVVAVWYPTASQPSQYRYSPTFSGLVALNAPPSTACGKRVPLIAFSHGAYGCGLQSVAFTEELARHGYVVAAPDHADALLCHTVSPPRGRSRPPAQLNVFKPETWGEATFADRRKDIEAVLDSLSANAEFKDVIDAADIGVAGHSLGGYTVVGMAGGWSSWTDPRIRAVLALSPYVMPFQVKNTLGSIRVPLMYQGGTLDIGITPFLKGPKGAYAQANPPVFFAELKNAGHLAWVNCGGAHSTASCLATNDNFRLISEYSVAFFNQYLKQQEEPLLLRKDPLLADYQFRLPSP
jgi:predicted dienelactone hydrolase